MIERPREPQTSQEWQNEVYLTKLGDRLVLLKNQSSARFDKALAAVSETDAFIGTGELPQFLVGRSEAAEQFAQLLGVTLDELLDLDTPYERFVGE